MKISNFFSASRLILAPVFCFLFFLPNWTTVNQKITLIIIVPIFIFLEFTDFLDGYYARKLNQVSDFGKHFDPFCDALANITILFCFMLDGFLPVIFFLIVLYREFSITFLRMIAMKKGFTIPAKMGGKTKTVFYILATGFSLFIKLLAVLIFVPEVYLNVFKWFNFSLYVVAIILSVATFIDYYFSYKKLLIENSVSIT